MKKSFPSPFWLSFSSVLFSLYPCQSGPNSLVQEKVLQSNTPICFQVIRFYKKFWRYFHSNKPTQFKDCWSCHSPSSHRESLFSRSNLYLQDKLCTATESHIKWLTIKVLLSLLKIIRPGTAFKDFIWRYSLVQISILVLLSLL